MIFKNCKYFRLSMKLFYSLFNEAIFFLLKKKVLKLCLKIYSYKSQNCIIHPYYEVHPFLHTFLIRRIG